jgi:hypothetical protein
VAPGSGAVPASGAFTFVSSDLNGAAYIPYEWILINNALDSRNACQFIFYRGWNHLYLVNDDNTARMGPVTAGVSGQPIENSQCRLDGGSSSSSAAGNTLTLNAGISFKPSLGGSRNVYTT